MPRQIIVTRPKGNQGNHTRKLSPEREAELVAAYLAGEKLAVIGKRLGMSEAGVFYAAKRHGLAKRGWNKIDFSAVQLLDMKERYARGETAKAIGRIHGVTNVTVLCRLREEGVAIRGDHDNKIRKEYRDKTTALAMSAKKRRALVERYVLGESSASIARDVDVSEAFVHE